jgi:hypothetical protein
MVENSRAYPRERLRKTALADSVAGGKGRANAVLVLPLAPLHRFYLSLPPGRRGESLAYEGAVLDGNVAAVLPGEEGDKIEVEGRQINK